MNFQQTIIACKVSNEFRNRIDAYITDRNISMSKFIRKSAEYLLESDPIIKNTWSVRS